MLEFAYYSVISPEGCAGILWKEANDETKRLAADALKLTARDLFRLRVIDDIIPEPLGAAHRDPRQMGNILKAYLLRSLRELKQIPIAGPPRAALPEIPQDGRVRRRPANPIAAAGNQ